jgi:hypothetical protein
VILAHPIQDDTQHDQDDRDAANKGAAAQCSSTGLSRGRAQLSIGNAVTSALLLGAYLTLTTLLAGLPPQGGAALAGKPPDGARWTKNRCDFRTLENGLRCSHHNNLPTRRLSSRAEEGPWS